MEPIQPQNPITPMRPIMGESLPARVKTSTGLIIVIVAALAVGAGLWYYFSYYNPEPSIDSPAVRRPAVDDAMTARLQRQGTSDELGAIEADLQTTDLSGLDQELADIEAELEP